MCGRFEVKLPGVWDWFDLWHTHVDWRGEGNGRPDIRRECVRELFAAWSRIESLAAADLKRPWQSWLIFDTADSGQDAVYLHTSNPNRDNYPYRFEGVTWGADPPHWLAEFLTDTMEVGRSEFEGGELFWVRRAGVTDLLRPRLGGTSP
jgi:hypothetical protein